MSRRRWLYVTPAVLALGAGGWGLLNPMITRGADRRIMDRRLLEIEHTSHRHLYAPTWLPNGGRVGVNGTMQGARRVLQDFQDKDERLLCILAQEPRDAGRDRYNGRIFVKAADARADINGKPAYFVTGVMGD